MIDKLNAIVGKSLNDYNKRIKPIIDDLKFKEAYQGRIIDCMVGEVDDNYIETPETNSSIVKLEHSKEGVVKIPSIKGKTILVDRDGNETNTPGIGCRYISVGEDEDNKLIILSRNKNLMNKLKEYNNETINGITYNSLDNGYLVVNGTTSKTLDLTYSSNTESDVILKPNTSYKLSIDVLSGTATAYSIACRTTDLITGEVAWHNSIIQPSQNPRKFYYARLYSGSEGRVFDNFTFRMQVEEGTVETSYVEPKYHKTEILLSEPLRSLPNGVCDEIVGNKVIRRVGIKKIISVADEGIVDVNVVD